jgi:hypothetical protein
VENGRKHASEKRSKLGVKGGLAPLGCLPLWGREGVTLSIALIALWQRFLRNLKNNSCLTRDAEYAMEKHDIFPGVQEGKKKIRMLT